MNKMNQDFVSKEPRKFHFQLGQDIASSLSGFIVGVIVTSIIWLIGVWYVGQIQGIAPHTPITDQNSYRVNTGSGAQSTGSVKSF